MPESEAAAAAGRKNSLASFVPMLLWMGIIFWLSSRPASALRPTGNPLIDLLREFLQQPYGDNIAHLLLYLILSLLGRIGFGGKIRGGAAVNLCICVVYGLSDECHQLFVPGRSFEFLDLASDAAGSALGALLPLTLRRGRV